MKTASIKSELVIGDIESLLKYAEKVTKKYNVADVFRLGGEVIKVEETIAFIERAYLAPLGDEKIMVICDVSTMTPQAQNKILKTVEDAPAHTNFLLLGTNNETILNTIKSRCVTRFLPTAKGIGLFCDTKVDEKTGANAPQIAEILSFLGLKYDEKALNYAQKYAILNAFSEYKRRVLANCNETNQKDFLVMEVMKCVRQ